MTLEIKSQSTINTGADFWFYKVGVNVIPAKTRDKIPIISWSEYQNNAIPNEIFESWKNANKFKDGIAVILGKVYRGRYKDNYLVGIDLDKQEGVTEFCFIYGKQTSLNHLAKMTLIEQHIDQQDKAHIFFYSPIPFPKKSADTILGIEVKSLGKHGLFCVSPSFHKNGYCYEPIGMKIPSLLTKQGAQSLIININDICIKHGLKYIDTRHENENKSNYPRNSDVSSKTKSKLTTSKIPIKVRNLIDRLKIPKQKEPLIFKGNRHMMFLSIAIRILFTHCKNRDDEYDNQDIKTKNQTLPSLKEYLFILNKTICNEPLSERELNSIWQSATLYHKEQKTVTANIKHQNKRKWNDRSGLKISIIERATENLLNKYHFLTSEETKEIFVYEKGVYVKKGDIIIEKELEKKFGYTLRTSDIIEVKNHIIRKTYFRKDEFDKDINIINLKNGLYDIEKNLLMPHNPKYYSVNQKPIIYDPDKRPMLFGQFLSQILYPQDIRTAIEIMAYTFYRKNIFELFFTFVGFGGNGKSVFTSIINNIHGNNNVSNVSIHSMINNRFAVSDLENKDVNIDTELSSFSINDISILKKLTGNHPIRIERKNRNAYDAKIHAKLIFNANKLPSNTDNSDAHFRREVIVSFPNQFEGKREDTQLLKKLSTKEEISGIFNILMEVLRRILKTQTLCVYEKTTEERRRKYELVTDSIYSFISQEISEESLESDYVTKDEFYNRFAIFCKSNKLPFMTKNVFDKELKKKYGFIDGRETKRGDSRKMIWKGKRLRNLINEYWKQELLTLAN